MKKRLRVSLCLFILTTLFLVSLGSITYAESANNVLNNIAADFATRRVESEAKRETDGTSLASWDEIYFDGSNINYFIEDNIVETDEGKLKFKLYFRENNDDKNVKRISGKIVKENNTVYFKTNSPLPILQNGEGTYFFGLEDSSGKIVSSIDINYSIGSTQTRRINTSMGFFEKAGAVITLNLAKIGKILIETFCKIITPMGDAFLDMICAAVGENVTIDSAVYNRVNKIDADFFNSEKDDADYYNSDGTIRNDVTIPLRLQMKSVVNVTYNLFKNIAIVVLLIMLVYVGIKIMFTSTAEKKASYKTVFTAWVLGVTMLMFFPYVMKYTIKLNDALCTWIGGNIKETDSSTGYNLTPGIYGTDSFVDKILEPGETVADNSMMYVRFYGANYYSIPLLAVYLIFIGQLLAILIIYYKRVFMLAFLISIFPLVAMIYPLNKIGDVRMNPFGTWFKEFLVNTFVQSFHAATYRVIVTLGINAYAETENWLFMIMCILFLFEGEKIIRAIFNAKSSMNSIGDMAMAGAMAMNIMKNAGNLLPDMSKNKGDKDKDEEMDATKKAKSDRIMATSNPTPGAESNLAEGRRASTSRSGTDVSSDNTFSSTSTSDSTGSAEDAGETFVGTPMDSGGTTDLDSSGVKLGRKAKEDSSTPFSTSESHIQNAKDENDIGKASSKVAKFAGSTFNAVSQATGATMGMTYGMAQSDSQAAVAGLAAGKSTGAKIGKAGKQLLDDAVDKYADIKAAQIVAGEYETGEHDDEIGVTSDMSEERQKALREAHARLAARLAGLGSKEGAQLKFIKERMEIEEKNK